jgi:hypothetical protein
MANDLNLHRCITKMPHTKIKCYERTRLYFLVYICDHHCSLIYGKPSLTREFESLKTPKAFLGSKFCTPADAKLISQIELWSISSRVFDVFGADIEASITNNELQNSNHSIAVSISVVLTRLLIRTAQAYFLNSSSISTSTAPNYTFSLTPSGALCRDTQCGEV